MRDRVACRLAGSLVLSLWPSFFAQAAEAPTEATKPYPVEVALDAEGDKGFLFRRFPGGQRLYIYDLDSRDKSACNIGCDGPRPPVYVSCDAKPMPDWSVIHRYNGLCQWSYKGHPLYTFFHDAPNDPKGDGEGGVWHLLGYIKP
jgi:predicted lipoprotein with Yx(FWY)xxD motif